MASTPSKCFTTNYNVSVRMKCFFLAVGICFGTTELALHISTLIQRKTKCVQFVFIGPYIVQSSFLYQTTVNCIQNVLYQIQCLVYGTEIYTKQPIITEVKYYNVTKYNATTTMLHFGRLYFQVMSSIKFLSFYLFLFRNNFSNDIDFSP